MDIPDVLLPDPTLLLVDAIDVDESQPLITLTATVIQSQACCPRCHHPAHRVHSRYQRTLADLPWAGVPVRWRLCVRRFFCDNPACGRSLFCERIPRVAAAWARRTRRLAHTQAAIGVAVGGAPGSRLCALLSMAAGVDLLLALIRQLPLPERATPRVLGVDDWAKAKGQTYGTLLVDLEQGQIVDVLPDRRADTLTQWLQEHPGVEIVSRDRAGAYADGIRAGAPEAIQVADRWHLLANLTEAVYKVLHHYPGDLQQALQPPPPTPPTTPEGAAHIDPLLVQQDPHVISPAQQRRAERVADVHRLHQAGWSGKDIAAHLNCHPKTVGRDLRLRLPFVPERHVRRKRLLDAFKPYLVARWNAGCLNATQLWREIQAQGFTGQISIVRDYVRHLRRASGLPPNVRSVTVHRLMRDPTIQPPTRRALAYLITRVPETLSDEEQRHLTRLSELHAPLAEVFRLAREFAALVRQQQVEPFDTWLEQALQSEAAPVRNFARSLQRDADAVRAALSLKWSNGPTEGHINRLKCLKRQMYGRARLDLLRHRLMAA